MCSCIVHFFLIKSSFIDIFAGFETIEIMLQSIMGMC